MIPLQGLSLEAYDSKNRKDRDRNNLLYNLKLHKCERATISDKTDTIGGNLTSILKESQKPTDEDDDVKWCIVRDELHLLQFEMSVPSKCHKDV